MADIDPRNLEDPPEDFSMAGPKPATTLLGKMRGLTFDQERLAIKLPQGVIGALKDYLVMGNDPHELAMMYMSELSTTDLTELLAEAFQAQVEIEAELKVGLEPVIGPTQGK